MPRSRDRYYEARVDYQTPRKYQKHNHKRHSSTPHNRKSQSPLKLSFLAGSEENAKNANWMKQAETADFIIKNGVFYAVKVKTSPYIECVKLHKINPVIKLNTPIRDYSSKRTPFHPDPADSIKPFKKDWNPGEDSSSNNSDESNLTSKEEAATVRLNDIIRRIETNMEMRDDYRPSPKHNSSYGKNRSGKITYQC
ncbi:hypothetical protein Aperf_G00000032129 [Anoplocephala perfoliata]